jgi:predicted Rossmann-fold nucleotide-binding protein
VNSFWDGLIGFMDHVQASGFLSPARRAQLLVAEGIGEAIDRLDAAIGATDPKMIW